MTVAVLALALVVRLGVVIASPDYTPSYDAADYDRLAWSIATDGHYPPTTFAEPGTPTALIPPGYPHVIGLTYAVMGHSFTAARVVGALLGAITVVLLALIARRLWGPVAGWIAGVVGALYPPLVLINASLISETLFLPLLFGLVLLLVMFPRPSASTAPWVGLAAGLLCGLLALTRSIGAVLVVVVLLWVWRLELTKARRLGIAALVVVVTVLTVVPWTARNARAFDTFVPVSTQDGAVAIGTYNEDAADAGRLKGAWHVPWALDEYGPLFNANLDEAEMSRVMRSDALRYARDHPDYPFVVLALNSMRIFGLGPGHRAHERVSYAEMGIPPWAHKWVRLSVYLMVLLAAAAFVIRRRTGGARIPVFIWVIPVLLLVGTALVLGYPRYRLPLDAFLVLVVAGGAAALLERRRATAESYA